MTLAVVYNVYWLLFIVKRLDWYIIRKFVGTYIFAILLIISISIVFDFNENMAKFANNHAPWRAIIFDYYANFVPYFANLFSPLFVFIAVIFFTSKLAGNSEIIAMLASGTSFRRLMRPYMLSAALIAGINFYLGAYIIPHGNIIRQNFETLYKNKKKQTSASNVALQVGPGIVASIQQYDNNSKRGFGFALYKFEQKKLVSQMTANVIQYDTISDSRYHWKATNYKIRTLKGLREKIETGAEIDTMIMMEPASFATACMSPFIATRDLAALTRIVMITPMATRARPSSLKSIVLRILAATAIKINAEPIAFNPTAATSKSLKALIDSTGENLCNAAAITTIEPTIAASINALF